MPFNTYSEGDRLLAMQVLVGNLKVQGLGFVPNWPVQVVGINIMIAALIELLYEHHGENLSVLMDKSINDSVPTNRIVLNPTLTQAINDGRGLIPVSNGTDCMAIHVEMIDGGLYRASLAYSAWGLSLVRNPSSLDVHISVLVEPEDLLNQTLLQLFRLTGQARFADMVRNRMTIRIKGRASGEILVADPRNYYKILGLDPFICKSYDEGTVTKMVRSALQVFEERYFNLSDPAAKKSASTIEQMFMAEVHQAATTLGNTLTRQEYNDGWLA